MSDFTPSQRDLDVRARQQGSPNPTDAKLAELFAGIGYQQVGSPWLNYQKELPDGRMVNCGDYGDEKPWGADVFKCRQDMEGMDVKLVIQQVGDYDTAEELIAALKDAGLV